MEIPVLGLGTWTLKGKTCTGAVKFALQMGYRHIDTAEMYGNEKAIGEALEEAEVKREELFITTKVSPRNLGRDDLLASANASLEKLGLDYVDLLLIHWPNENVPLEETLEAMKELKKDGKVKHIGVSNFTPELLDRALEIAEITCNQVEMHPFLQQEEMVEYCKKNDLILTAYSPLAKGKVVGNETLEEIGEKYDRTPAQVSLRWLIQQENVVAIPKSSKEEHQKENLQAINFHLEDEDMERISEIEKEKRLVEMSYAPWR